MAKNLSKASDYVVEFIENIISEETTLERYITWRIFSVDNQKEMIKVSKASATVEYLAKTEYCIIFYVNEELFDMLAPDNANSTDLRKLIVKDVLNTVNIVLNDNTASMKIKIEKPQIAFTLDGYQNMGQDLVKAYETERMAFRQIEEKKKEEKLEKQSKKSK